MNPLRTLPGACLVLPALIVLAPRGELPSFRPAAGTTLRTTYESHSEIALEDMQMAVAGREMPTPEVEMETTQDLRLVLSDTYAQVDGGRVMRLVRRFEEVSQDSGSSFVSPNPQLGSREFSIAWSTPLEGLAVAFDRADPGWDVGFAEGSKGEAELLRGLAPDLDLAGFLPGEAVETGDRWEADAEVFRALLAPAGSLKLEPDTEELDPALAGQFRQPPLDVLLDTVGGSVTCELAELRDEAGVRVARIAFDFSIQASNDLTAFAQRWADEQERPAGMPPITITSDRGELDFSGSGELLWDLDAGRAHSLELNGRRTMTETNTSTMEAGDDSLEMTGSTTLGGTMTVRIRVTSGS